MVGSDNELAKTAEALRNNNIGLLDYINHVCDRIEKIEPFVKALMPEKNRRERLLNEATILLKNYPSVHDRPPLFGIPVGIKDLFCVDGFETKCGSLLPSSLFKGDESSVVTKLKSLGALILGKTVTTEFAYFEPGPTCNPHNIKHTPGGSSSGSAAAVAAGFCPLTFGTQTIGSITRPASFCGVFGFKPSYGRIPTDGVVPFSKSVDHIGFFTRDIEGIILSASLFCTEWKEVAINSEKPLRIGVPAGEYLDQVDTEIREFFENAIEKLEQNGVEIIRTDAFGKIEELNKTHKAMIASDFYNVHKDWFLHYEYLYREHSKKLILEGKNVSSEILQNARLGREILRNKLNSLQEELLLDLWISPSTMTTAPEGLSSTGSPLMNLPWTYAGVPTLSVPAGKNANGLPLGLQFSGRFNDEETMLKVIAEKIIPLI
jgi:Asp-tRNA(Asn)/Glu-tRNA(Gln) amidotransferase A subunit family amidase